MRFYVKCVQCGRVAGVQFARPLSMNAAEQETPEQNIRLDGYIVRCPGCSQQRTLQNRAAAVRTEVASILAANLEHQKQSAQARQQIEHLADQLGTRESEARTDPLTRLSNRRAFAEEMTRLLSAWERKSIPFTLLMIDVDDFKRFNDSYGHQVGDGVLCGVARIISGQLRGMDVAFRYGGEEFAVLLPSTNPLDAGVVAERIRAAIEKTAITSAKTELTATASVGVADVILSDESDELVRRADEALYAAKRAGRNCVRWHNGEEIITLAPLQSSSTKHCRAANQVDVRS